MNKNKLLDHIRKSIPLYTRLKVRFEMEWLAQHIIPDREATDEEILKAVAWGEEMATWIIRTIKSWEDDGKPI